MWGPEPWTDVNIEVELVGWKQPPTLSHPQRLFKTPLAQQRYAMAMDTILEMQARSVLDLGCGEGRLLEYILLQVCWILWKPNTHSSPWKKK
jgi:2-polyprenyl-3-methyl-5-hydroxy-6-metoxy-1,4-benzoquinol methylase